MMVTRKLDKHQAHSSSKTALVLHGDEVITNLPIRQASIRPSLGRVCSYSNGCPAITTAYHQPFRPKRSSCLKFVHRSRTRYSASQRGSHSGDQDGKSALPVQSPSRDPFPRCYATLPSGHDALHGHLVLAQHAVRFDRSEMERTREGETWNLLSVLSNVLTITRISQTMPVREHSPCSQWRLGCSYPRMLRKKPCSITVSCAVHWRSLHTRLSCSQDSPPEEVFQLVRVWKNYSTSSETMISDLPSKG